jgi:hypothetical protein
MKARKRAWRLMLARPVSTLPPTEVEAGDTRTHDPAGLPTAFEPIDDAFFDDIRDPPPQEDDPPSIAPRDPVLERKMSLAVQARRERFTRLAMGAVGCAALLILVAALLHLASGAPKESAAEMHAVSTPAAPSTHALSTRASTSPSAL